MQTARTTQSEPVAAAEDLIRQLQGGETPKLVTLFASRERDQLALNRAVRERLPKGTRLVGATTAGELDNQGMHSGSVVLGALSGDFEVGLGLGSGLSVDAVGAGGAAIKRAAQELGVRQSDLDPRQYVGLVIDDGFRYKKEELLLGILEKNQTLVLVGGGAADHEQDPAKQSALLHVDGEVATDAVLVALFKTSAPWAALRSHWYQPTGERLTITRVDESATRALEIDGRPAAQRYAELLGVPVDELEFGKPRGFAVHPTALKVGREYFIRAPWKPLRRRLHPLRQPPGGGHRAGADEDGGHGRHDARLLPGGAAPPRPEPPGHPAFPLQWAHVVRQHDRHHPPARRDLAPRTRGGWNECALRDLLGVPHQHDADGAGVRGKLTDEHSGSGGARATRRPGCSWWGVRGSARACWRRCGARTCRCPRGAWLPARRWRRRWSSPWELAVCGAELPGLGFREAAPAAAREGSQAALHRPRARSGRTRR